MNNIDIRDLINDSEAIASEKGDNIIKAVNKSFKVKDTFGGDDLLSRGLFVIKEVDITSVSPENYLVGSIVRDSNKKNLYVCELYGLEKKWTEKTSEAILPTPTLDNSFLYWDSDNGFTWVKGVKVTEKNTSGLPATGETGEVLLLSSSDTGQQLPYICIRI